jgi:hypothetical protein
MSVAFKELAGSPLETFSAEGMRAQRRLVVAWEDRHAMVAQLLGEGYQLGGASPAAYPGRQGIVAIEVQLEPWPASPDDQGPFTEVTSQLNSYSGKFAQLTVDYELLDAVAIRSDLPPPHPGTVLTYRMELGGESMRIGGENLHWQSNPQWPVSSDAVPALRIPIIEHHLTWHRVVRPPWGAIRNATGGVNAELFLGAPAETILFDGAMAKKQFLGLDPAGEAAFGWRVTYVFREKAIKRGSALFGWNHRYRTVPSNTPGWDRLLDGNDHTMYRLVSFDGLFQFAP